MENIPGGYKNTNTEGIPPAPFRIRSSWRSRPTGVYSRPNHSQHRALPPGAPESLLRPVLFYPRRASQQENPAKNLDRPRF